MPAQGQALGSGRHGQGFVGVGRPRVAAEGKFGGIGEAVAVGVRQWAAEAGIELFGRGEVGVQPGALGVGGKQEPNTQFANEV